MLLVPNNWADLQHYKDRSPPWIKLHKKLLDNYEFQCLPVASRALAPMLWLLASEHENGEIDADPRKLAFRLRMSEQEASEALQPLVAAGFFSECKRSASKALAKPRAAARPEAERETEKEKEQKRVPPAPQGGEALFEKFYAAFPRKEGKSAAKKAFDKLNADEAMVAQMVQALEWQKQREQWNRDNGRFIPMPATWLNKGQWQDSRPGDTTEWHETRSGVEARGIELGLGPWVEVEQFGVYKSRVMKAHQERAH